MEIFSIIYYNRCGRKVLHYKGGTIIMTKWECQACGYIYDPAEGDVDNGIDPGTSFADLPEDWVCPMCGVGKDMFEELA